MPFSCKLTGMKQRCCQLWSVEGFSIRVPPVTINVPSTTTCIRCKGKGKRLTFLRIAHVVYSGSCLIPLRRLPKTTAIITYNSYIDRRINRERQMDYVPNHTHINVHKWKHVLPNVMCQFTNTKSRRSNTYEQEEHELNKCWHDDVIKWKHFRVTGNLCGEFTGPRWIPRTKPVTRSFDVFFDLRLN